MTSALDIILSQIKIPSSVMQFYFWGYLLVLVFGFIGNILSFLTFTRPTLRNTSTGYFFIMLTVSDSLHLFIFLLVFLEIGLQVRIYKIESIFL